MKKFVSILMVAMVTLICNIAFAFNVPVHNGFVNDYSGKLSANQLQKLNDKVQNVNRQTANEIGVLLIPSLEGESIEDVTYQTFNTWKVGKVNLDNGVLLVIAVNDHKMRIETGKGVGGDLTDLQTKDIQDHMKPFLRKGNFYGAVDLAVNEIGSSIESRRQTKSEPSTPAPAPVATSQHTSAPSGCQTSTVGKADVGFGFLLMAAFATVVFFVLRRSNRKKMEAAKARADREAQEWLHKMKKVDPKPKKAPILSHPSTDRKETLRFSPVYTPPPAPKKVVTPLPKKAVHATPSQTKRTVVPTPAPSYRAPDPSPAPSISFDWGSSSGGSDFGGGGDFGGGSSGGGGSSSDW